jgi:hypothetical protein
VGRSLAVRWNWNDKLRALLASEQMVSVGVSSVALAAKCVLGATWSCLSSVAHKLMLIPNPPTHTSANPEVPIT